MRITIKSYRFMDEHRLLLVEEQLLDNPMFISTYEVSYNNKAFIFDDPEKANKAFDIIQGLIDSGLGFDIDLFNVYKK